MIAYIIRRVLYGIPILIGVNLITFVLFFVVNSPEDMARMHLGMKHVTEAGIDKWKADHGYDKPLVINKQAQGIGTFTETIFFEKSAKLFVFQFGQSDSGRDIGHDISQRMWPSLAIALPNLILGLLAYITFAMLVAFFRGTYLDVWGVVLCVVLMSISVVPVGIAPSFSKRLVKIMSEQHGLKVWRSYRCYSSMFLRMP
jgi:peptide/nickel transport system permease protein